MRVSCWMVALVSLAALPGGIGAREPMTLPTRILSAAGAKHVLASAEQAAAAKGVKVSIAIVDTGGNLLAFQRMDAAKPNSTDAAIGKARTAAQANIPSRRFQEVIDGGKPALLSMPNLVPLQGGMPLIADGIVVGGIGVSGASPENDELVATAGAAVLAETGAK